MILGITRTFIFHSFLSSLAKPWYLSIVIKSLHVQNLKLELFVHRSERLE